MQPYFSSESRRAPRVNIRKLFVSLPLLIGRCGLGAFAARVNPNVLGFLPIRENSLTPRAFRRLSGWQFPSVSGLDSDRVHEIAPGKVAWIGDRAMKTKPGHTLNSANDNPVKRRVRFMRPVQFAAGLLSLVLVFQPALVAAQSVTPETTAPAAKPTGDWGGAEWRTTGRYRNAQRPRSIS